MPSFFALGINKNYKKVDPEIIIGRTDSINKKEYKMDDLSSAICENKIAPRGVESATSESKSEERGSDQAGMTGPGQEFSDLDSDDSDKINSSDKFLI